MSTLAVYDCMLFFRAAARPRLARPLFDFVHGGQVTLCLSPDVLAEIRDVLTRPKLVAKYPALTKQAVDAFLARHMRMATWINDVPEHYVLARDSGGGGAGRAPTFPRSWCADGFSGP